MFDHEALRQRIAAVQPIMDLKKDQLCIAIIPHTASYFDTFAANDCMWVKCPLSKKIDVLLNAYKKKHPPTHRYPNLLHEGGRLDPFDEVSMLGDPRDAAKVVLLKATDTAETLTDEYIESIMTPSQPPAQSTTLQSPRPATSANTRPPSSAISIPASSVAPESATRTHTWRAPMTPDQYQTPTPNLPVSNPMTPIPTTPIPTAAPSTTPIVSTPVPAAISRSTPVESRTTLGMSAIEVAWADFNYFRRSWRIRKHGQSSLDNIIEQHTINQDWRRLDGDKIKELEVSAGELEADSLLSRRAFWDFYCKQLGGGTNLEEMYLNRELFNYALQEWRRLQDAQRERIGRQLRSESDIAIPPLPTTEEDESMASIETKEEDIADFKQSIADDRQSTDAQGDAEDASAITTRLDLNQMFCDKSTLIYEQGVAKGLDILAKLRAALSNAPGTESDQWLAYLAKVEQHAERTRTVIGVVGATGAGKSSVINALMDEERLLPTNCMRACTAVVTELSYNYKNERYRAEIEFISPDD